jgi:predicted membrane protein
MADECTTIRGNAGRLALGLVVIAIGVLFTLDRLGYVDAGDFWEYWPVLLIAIGVGRVVQPRGSQERGFGVVLILFGSWFLLSNFDIIHYSFGDVWPVLLVVLGIMMVWRAITGPFFETPRRRLKEAVAAADGSAAVAGIATSGADTSSTVNSFALLGGVKRKVVSQDFRGGALTAILGGCELDLRHASISSGQAVIDTFALWGGIEIKVPQEWSVVVQGTPILGAFDDKTVRVGGDGSKVLVIKGIALMGGVDIKN